jgi:hypothetical protein
MFGVNPWTLMNWMGHKRIDETMRYVHFAGAHMRPLPAAIVAAAAAQTDPENESWNCWPLAPVAKAWQNRRPKRRKPADSAGFRVEIRSRYRCTRRCCGKPQRPPVAAPMAQTVQ